MVEDETRWLLGWGDGVVHPHYLLGSVQALLDKTRVGMNWFTPVTGADWPSLVRCSLEPAVAHSDQQLWGHSTGWQPRLS
jgi:hypothetical protein